MEKENQGLTWNPVQLEGDLLNSGNFDGLIGIEECLDYQLDSVISHKKVKKRKITSSDEVLKDVSKKLKVKNKKKQSTINSASDIESQDNQLTPSKAGGTDRNISTRRKEVSNRNNDDLDENVDESTEELYAWNSFGLPRSLLKAIKDLRFKEPTPIQALTLPPAILGRRDILGAAETGSGKTLAFGLPILTGILKCKEKACISKSDFAEDGDDNSDDGEEVLEENSEGIGCVKVIDNIQLDKLSYHKKPLYALILTPTRELAVQVKNHLIAAAKYTGIKVAVVLGGMAVVKQERILNKGPEIVVATPGRLWELIQEGNPHLSQIDDIRFLAIDETDRMIEKGHFKELKDLLERLTVDKEKCKQRQNFVFSATLTLVHELPRYLTLKRKIRARYSKKISKLTPQQKVQEIINLLGITNPKVVDVTQKSGTAETLSECRITCAIDEKDYYVYYFLQKHPGRTLIFCNSIGCVKRLTTLLGLLGCNPMALHASMQQRQRLKNLDRFRDNENAVLIATDVAARGLDIPCVEHVLHYQTPRTSESYVHRSGRTARASREGITVLLVEPSEMQNYLKLCKTLGREQDLPQFPVQNNYLNAVKQRVQLARELDKLELQVRKANSESGWIQKAAEEMDILIDDNISTKYDKKEVHAAKKVAEVKRKQLAALLAKSLLPKGFSAKYPLVSAENGILCEPSEQKSEKAVDVLKTSVENYTKDCRKKVKWLFKPKSWTNHGNKDATESAEKKESNNKKIKRRRNRNKHTKVRTNQV